MPVRDALRPRRGARALARIGAIVDNVRMDSRHEDSARRDASALPSSTSSSAAYKLPVPVSSIAALSFAAFAAASSLRVTDAALTRIAAEFDLTLSAASYAITMFSLAYGLCQLVFGPTGDRFGKVRVIGWVCTFSVFTALLCAWSPNYPALLVARALAGIGGAAIVPLSMAWLGDVIPYERRQPVLARFLTGQILGIAFGGLIGGFAADHVGWRSAFLLIAVWYAVAAVMLMRVQRTLPAQALVKPIEGQSAIANMISAMRDVVSRRWPRVILVTVFLEGATLFGAFAFIATHMHNRYGLSLTLAGGVALLFGAGGLAFAIASGWLVSRLGEIRLPLAGALLVGVSFLLIGLIASAWLTLPCMFAAGTGFYMFHNSLQTQATQMVPERRGAAVSLFAFCYFLGQSLGVVLAGYLLHLVDTGTVIALGGACVIAVGWGYARTRRRRA